MDILDNLALGFQVAAGPMNLLYCFTGVLLGTSIGVLPGVGPLITIAVLLPVTFGLPADGALIMLAGIYYGAAYGGSTTAILVNLPGESSSVVTCFDGYQMARRGRAGAALAIAALSSFLAGCVATILIAFFAPILSSAALEFGAAEYFSLMLMALVLTAGLVHGSIIKGIGLAMLGILFGLVGTDISSGFARYTFGIPGLVEGIDFVVIAMGVFAFAEIVRNLESQHGNSEVTTTAIGSLRPTRQELVSSTMPAARGTLVGSFFGILPGAGQAVSSFAAYALEKRVNREGRNFGTGVAAGVAAPEAANNAAAQTSFIPTLTLGVPGSATMALMLGALMMQGISPGPQVMTQHPQLFWGLIASMWIGNFMLVLLNLPLVGVWVKLLKIPYRWLVPGILAFSCLGIYTVNLSVVDVTLAAGFGFLGYVFYKLDCEPAPFILGFVLGPMIEENFRRAMLLARGDVSTLVTHPISAGFLLVTLVFLIGTLVPAIRRRKDAAIQEAD